MSGGRSRRIGRAVLKAVTAASGCLCAALVVSWVWGLLGGGGRVTVTHGRVDGSTFAVRALAVHSVEGALDARWVTGRGDADTTGVAAAVGWRVRVAGVDGELARQVRWNAQLAAVVYDSGAFDAWWDGAGGFVAARVRTRGAVTLAEWVDPDLAGVKTRATLYDVRVPCWAGVVVTAVLPAGWMFAVARRRRARLRGFPVGDA